MVVISPSMPISGPYTDHPAQLAGIVFPNQSMQALSSVIHLFGCSILAFCFARRTTGEPFFSWHTWMSMSWPRLCVLLVFLDSWLFLFSTGLLIGGAGMSSSFLNCALGIYACILLYAGSKMLIYSFLIEKVHVVWGGTHQPRLHSKVYWGCLVTMMPYVAIVIMMLIGRVAYFRDDRSCIIGLRKYAIKKMAMRTLVAAFAALTTSTINIAVLTIMHGQQLGWVCLGSCGADVTVNALVLFWVTDNIAQGGSENSPTHCPTNAPGAPVVSNQSLPDDEGVRSHVHISRERVSSVIRRGEPVVFGKPTGRRSKSFISKIGDVLRSKKDDVDDGMHQMSVQVTITTEQQGDIMMNDVKYAPRSESINESIGTSRMDLEKGEVEEEGRKETVQHGHQPHTGASGPGCALVAIALVRLVVLHASAIPVNPYLGAYARPLCSLSEINSVGGPAIASCAIASIDSQCCDSVAPGSSTDTPAAPEANGGKAKKGTIFKYIAIQIVWSNIDGSTPPIGERQAAAILSHISPAKNGMGTSLPEDRSLWPAYLSGGLLPMPTAGTSVPITPAAPSTTAYREREASVATSVVEDDEDMGESSDEREDSGYGSSSAALAVPGRPQPRPHQTYGIATSIGGHEYTLSSSHAGCDAGAHIGSMAYQFSIGRSMSASSFGVSSLRGRDDEEEEEPEGAHDDHNHTHTNGNGRKWDEDESMAMDMDL
ncbi:unnamed protein product [Rhizoctonia solani]|uniref:Transmembrane protein n=1 Tax=Rhizoctonia solani TaxID=456999 RepID=A0A8H2Y3N2_9AGAM|nr:unnamed protein product [Rhizoctonia solani]